MKQFNQAILEMLSNLEALKRQAQSLYCYPDVINSIERMILDYREIIKHETA